MGEMRGFQLEHRADMRGGFHFVGVKAERCAAVNGTAFDRGDEHCGEASVQAEFGGASYLGGGIGAACAPADESKVRRILQWRIRGKRKRGYEGEELREGQLALSRPVEDKAIFGAALGVWNVPLRGGCGEEHLAGGSASFAESVVRSANAPAASGELFPILRVQIGLDDLHA